MRTHLRTRVEGEIRATICEIRVEHKIALSMVSLSSTDVGRNPAPLSSVSVQGQSAL